jgi:CRISPR-associated protein Cas2
MRTVIAFDVSDDRKRYRLVKVLKEYATRVQKSVFEAGDLKRSVFLRMRSRLERHIDPATDSIRYYQLCDACVARIEHFGAGPGVLDPPKQVAII